MSAAGADISLVIPVLDGERHISAAVESARLQDPAPREIIVVDDGSTDGTAAIVRALPGIRYAWQPTGGPGAARNHGARLATGELLAFLDADDAWAPGKTALQATLLREHPDVDLVVGHTQRVVEAGSASPAPVGDPVFFLHLGAMLVRRTAFDRVGAFEERPAGMGEDVDWFLRAKEIGLRMRFHREVVQVHRYHEANMTRDRGAADRDLVRTFKRSVDRRRAQGAGATLAGWDEEMQWLDPEGGS